MELVKEKETKNVAYFEIIFVLKYIIGWSEEC